MKGDFSRLTFDPSKRYDSVRMQQGRVQVDADWNEQVDIATWHREQALADLIGGCCAPEGAAGFGITADGGDLDIGVGRVYVDGILCEQLDPDLSYLDQPDFPDAALPDTPGTYLVYLDVWKWHVTALEDADIRETALGGRDTATRLKTVCQVKLQSVPDGSDCAGVAVDGPTLGGVAARTRPEEEPDDPCVVPAAAGYTRLENYLYRIEVHDGGVLGVDAPTFKWSRNNATIVTDWLSQQATNPNRLIVRSTGRDELLGFHDARWVELIDDDRELRGEPGLLVEVVAVEDDVIEIDPGALTIDIADFGTHPKIRRWDMDTAGGAMAIEIAGDNDGYLAIESGIQVLFGAGSYRTGDYWLIPARAFIGRFAGDIEWPADGSGNPVVAQPHGVRHHSCKLALVTFDGTDFAFDSECRHTFTSLCELAPGCCTVAVEPGESIQAAIDALPPEGGCICLKTGVHELDETLRIERSDVLIHGESPGTRVTGAVLPLLSIGVLTPRPARIEVRDIRFEALADAAGDAVPAVLGLASCDDVTIERCGIGAQSGQVSGITLWDTDHISIADCEIAVSMNGIRVIEDSLALEIRGNRIHPPPGTNGEDSGGIGIFAEMQFAPCILENNRIEGFRVGIALSRDPFGGSGFSGADRSEVIGNRVTRVATGGAGDDRQLFGIDIAAADCRVCGNTLVYASSRYGGVRATASRIVIADNRLTSLVPSLDADELPVGVQVGLGTAKIAADDVHVRDNVIRGVQDAVVVLGAAGIIVSGNDISAPKGELRAGILFDGVTGGNAERNHIAGADTAVQFSNGERNRAFGNAIERGGSGVFVEQDNDAEIGNNRIRETGWPAILIGSWVGTARLHHNRCRGCCHQLSGASMSIAAVAGYGELQVESCEVRDTGLSPADGTLVSPALGVFGYLVMQASLQSNNIAAVALDGSGDPATMPVQRAVFLLGLLDLQLTDVSSLAFPCQILDNRFNGVGGETVVEVAGSRVNERFWMRFNRVQYCDNFCWHLNPNQDDAVTVRIAAASASAMGNHFKTLARVAPIDFGATSALYIGNVADGAQALGGSILPSPQNAFNR